MHAKQTTETTRPARREKKIIRLSLSDIDISKEFDKFTGRNKQEAQK